MKQITILLVVVAVMLLGASAIIISAQDNEVTLTYLPTSIPANLPGSGDEAFNRIHGGVIYNGVAIMASEDENLLLLQQDAAQTQVPVQIQNSSGTPVFQIEVGGAIDSEAAVDTGSYLVVGAATPVVVMTRGAGDVNIADDTEITDDLHVEGSIKVGLATPASITWDDDDLAVNDDFEVIDDGYIGDDFHVGGAMKVGVATPVGITWNDDDLVVNDDFEVISDAHFQGAVKLGVATPVVVTSIGVGDIVASDDAEVIDDAQVGGGLKVGVATPVIVTSVDTGDIVASDDAEVVDDLTVTGALAIGVPTPVGITWDDDDLKVKDDSYFEGDIQASSFIKIGVATPAAITSPGAGDLVASGDLEVVDDTTMGGSLTMAGILIDTPQASAATDNYTLTATSSVVQLSAAGSCGTSSITAGTAGQVLIIIGPASNTVTFTDTGTLKLGGSRALSANDTLSLIADGTNWNEFGFVNN